ncbi:MAG TPA: sigma 54-interacting transcriptional regulator [bacterium]|nr:sigma 54-interacting transcriptional regulator [bacterium]
MDLDIPDTIDGQYRVLKRLGEGLSGEVFQVRKDKDEWALKLLKVPPENANAEGWIDAFKFEFSLLKDIQHPNVVRIGDFGWDRELGRLYYTQEFLRGRPLTEFLEDQPFAKAEEIFLQCLEGLEAIHVAPALHGDLKPSNLFVVATSSGPLAKILDLGMAHPRLRARSGTGAYMAPEKVLGDSVDERADLYSLGVSFYEALTGTNPFFRQDPMESLKAQTAVKAAPVGTLNPEVPPYFNRILMQLLSKNPRDRFRSARAVMNELQQARGETSGAQAAEAPVVSERWIGREDAVESVREWSRGASFSILAVAGDAGVGKSRLLQEMKYDLELAGLSVRSIGAETLAGAGKDAIVTLDADAPPDWNEVFSKLAASARGLLVALSTADLEKLRETAARRKIPLTALSLRPFTPEEVRDLIRLSSRDENPPMTLALAIFEETHGHPGRTVRLLSALCRRKGLLDAEGRWNLAVFREGGVDLDAVLEEEPVADEEISRVSDDRPDERTALLIRKMRDALRAGDTGGAGALVKECERVVKLIPDQETRLKRRAEILERRAWLAILSGHIYEALSELESAKTLLEESAATDPALILRLRNFEAFALMRSGKIDEAIARFEETHRRWKEELSDEEKSQVVNNDLAAALMQKSRYAEAIDVQKQYLKFFEGRADEAQILRAHYQLGECHLNTSSFKKAIEHYRAAAAGARRLRQWDMLLRAYNGLGNALNHQHKPHEGIEYYQRALDLARYRKDYAAAAAVAQNIGGIQKDLGLEEPAREHLELSLKLIGRLPEPSVYGTSLKLRATLELGELARERSDFETARELLSEARKLAASDKSLEAFSFFVFLALANLSLDQGRFDDFAALYPDLQYHAKTAEQKERVEFLRKRSPVDPSQPTLSDAAPAPVRKAEPSAPRPETSAPQDAPWLRAVLDINQSLLTEKELDRLLQLILRHALSLSSAESGLVLLADERGRLSVASSLNIAVDEGLTQISRSVAERVLREDKALAVDDAGQDKELKANESVILLGLKSVFCAPIRAQQKVIGVLYLIHRFRPGLFDARAEEILLSFAGQAGLAIENARLIASIAEKNKSLEIDLKDAGQKIDAYESMIREGLAAPREAYPDIVARSPAMERVFSLLDRIAASNLSVLVQGESGTGKELIARALHKNSARKSGRFIAVNCGALPANLIESELFGYKAGAFTDAKTDKKGLLEEANGGTVFLDEIGDLDLGLQVKLLRALQEREIVRLGDSVPLPIDVRLVTATHRDLRRRMAEGAFREDLFYRIAEIQVDLPPLRERQEDIPLLARSFAQKFADEQGAAKPPKISRELMKAFLVYPWPGNVRELGNRIRVACALSDGKILQLADLPEGDRKSLLETAPLPTRAPSPAAAAPSSQYRPLLDEGKSWREIETVVMAKALLHFDFDVAAAARSLRVAPATLYNRLRRERFRRRREEFLHLPYPYAPGTPLEEIKRDVFRAAFRLAEEKPYHAARRLKVSPGMFYRWAQNAGV